jgi:hypothetical protein
LFEYYGFEWLKPWPGDGLYRHFGLMGLLAAMKHQDWILPPGIPPGSSSGSRRQTTAM